MTRASDRVADEAIDRATGVVHREVSDRRYRLGFVTFVAVQVVCWALLIFS